MNTEQLVKAAGNDHVEYYRFASVKYQLKLESKGLRSTSGALRPQLAVEFGLKPRAPHAEYIAYCQARMEELLAAKASTTDAF